MVSLVIKKIKQIIYFNNISFFSMFRAKEELRKWRLLKHAHLEQINNERLYQLILEVIAVAGQKHLVVYVDRMDQAKCRLPSHYRFVSSLFFCILIKPN